MSSKSSVLFSALIATILAIALIIAFIYVGVPQQQKLQQGNGTLAVLLTDPPTVPIGTTALYANYTDFAIHISTQPNDSGWVDLHSSGSINLMGILNATQTIASAKVEQGYFNAMRFNISSAVITYNEVNYSVGLIYERHVVYIPIQGGISIQNGATTVSVVDLAPTVLLIGTPSSPSFVLIPSARGYVLPASSVSNVHTEVGERDEVDANPALSWLHQNSHFQITSAQLTPDSLSITVTNTGNASLVFRVADVTSTQSPSGGFKSGLDGLPPPAISEYFAISPNSSLIALTGAGKGEVPIYQTLAANGYFLPPKASVSFTFSGPIVLGALAASYHPVSISQGQRYIVKIAASGLIASTEITAT